MHFGAGELQRWSIQVNSFWNEKAFLKSLFGKTNLNSVKPCFEMKDFYPEFLVQLTMKFNPIVIKSLYFVMLEYNFIVITLNFVPILWVFVKSNIDEVQDELKWKINEQNVFWSSIIPQYSAAG